MKEKKYYLNLNPGGAIIIISYEDCKQKFIFQQTISMVILMITN